MTPFASGVALESTLLPPSLAPGAEPELRNVTLEPEKTGPLSSRPSP
jgi:hypothetical protein